MHEIPELFLLGSDVALHAAHRLYHRLHVALLLLVDGLQVTGIGLCA